MSVPVHMHAKAADACLIALATAGMPKVLNAFTTIASVGIVETVKADGAIQTYLSDSNAIYIDAFRKGERIMKDIFGADYSHFRHQLRMLHPAFDRWVVQILFGRLLGRGVLTTQDAMLCFLTGLSSTGVFPQMKSVVRAILSSGVASEDVVRGVLDQTRLLYDDDAQVRIDAVWADFNRTKLKQPTLADKIPRDDHVWSYDTDLGEKSGALWTARAARRVDGKASFHEHSPPDAPSCSSAVHRLLRTFRKPSSLSHTVLVCALLSAHTAAGNLTGVVEDWSYLPREDHGVGLEALMQSVVFAGFHNTLNALVSVHRYGVHGSAIDYPREDALAREDPKFFFSRGDALMQRIYGKQLSRLLEKLDYEHPDLRVVIEDWAYGKVLGRECSGLRAQDRELIAIPCLAGFISIPQLHSHMLGAMNCGATLSELRCVLDQIEPLWGRAQQAMADGFWLEFERDMQKKQKAITLPAPV